MSAKEIDKKSQLAIDLLKQYKKDTYSFGLNCFNDFAKFVKEFGNNTLLIISQHDWASSMRNEVKNLLNLKNIKIVAEIGTSRENTPLEDVKELANLIKKTNPDNILCIGGGSAIDCAKAANILAVLSPDLLDIEPFFGAGIVSETMTKLNIKELYPLIAVQVAAGSGSHITKYSNVTDLTKNQKKLIVDEAIIPNRAVFDYLSTLTMPLNLTKDGAMDGFSHCLEVYYGVNENVYNYNLVEQICLTGIGLIIENLPLLIKNPQDKELRQKIGLATDLGAYAIMLYGTNGAHLNSFSFVDIMTHGKACAILNPYYTVFFAPSIENKLKKLAFLYKDYLNENIENLKGKELGIAIAKAMTEFSKIIGFPYKLEEIKGFSDLHINRALEAAKNPQLKSKLENMPVPLSADQIDEYMKPVLLAAKTGDFNLIKTMEI